MDDPRSMPLDRFELTPEQEQAYAALGLLTVGDLVAVDPARLSDPVRHQSRELLASLSMDFGAGPPPPPVRSPLELALRDALEQNSTAAFSAALRGGWAERFDPTPRDREAVLGLSALVLGNGARSAAEDRALIDAVLARWPLLVAGTRPSQADDFLANALAASDQDPLSVARLTVLAAGTSSPRLLFSLARASAVAGDDERVAAALAQAFAAGVHPAQVTGDAAFSKALQLPAVSALFAGLRPAPEPFNVAPLLPALAREVAQIRALCEKLGLKSSWPGGATAALISEAEQRSGLAFPNEYRALLTLHDGPVFDDVRVLGTRDFAESTELLRRAREFIEDAASYGTTELLENIPLANLGQPNDWLFYDPRRAADRFVLWLNADDVPQPSLAAALEWQRRVMEGGGTG